jgi:hypothetical protein
MRVSVILHVHFFGFEHIKELLSFQCILNHTTIFMANVAQVHSRLLLEL